MSIHRIIFLFIVILFSNSCKKSLQVDSPKFDKTAAYTNVRQQVNFGPRVPGSAGHLACKDWLVSQFKSTGAEVIEQGFTANTFDGKSLPAFNIIASFNKSSKYRIVLAAHWDTRPFSDYDPDTSFYHKPILGADDGASGVAVLLEVAKAIQSKPLKKYGVDIVLFDAEDYGNDKDNTERSINSWCLGAQHWSKTPHTPGYKADYGVLLDMVGAKDARFTKEAVSMQYAPKVVEKVWTIAKAEGFSNFFSDELTGGLTDDHSFVNAIANIPMIDIINRPATTKTGFPHHWHTQKDDLNAIEPLTLHAVGTVIIKLLYLEDVDKI